MDTAGPSINENIASNRSKTIMATKLRKSMKPEMSGKATIRPILGALNKKRLAPILKKGSMNQNPWLQSVAMPKKKKSTAIVKKLAKQKKAKISKQIQIESQVSLSAPQDTEGPSNNQNIASNRSKTKMATKLRKSMKPEMSGKATIRPTLGTLNKKRLAPILKKGSMNQNPWLQSVAMPKKKKSTTIVKKLAKQKKAKISKQIQSESPDTAGPSINENIASNHSKTKLASKLRKSMKPEMSGKATFRPTLGTLNKKRLAPILKKVSANQDSWLQSVANPKQKKSTTIVKQNKAKIPKQIQSESQVFSSASPVTSTPNRSDSSTERLRETINDSTLVLMDETFGSETSFGEETIEPSLVTSMEKKELAIFCGPMEKNLRSSQKRLILIDGSNVAFAHSLGKNFSVKGLSIAINHFEMMGHEVRAVVPLFRLTHCQTTEPIHLQVLHQMGKIVVIPHRHTDTGIKHPYDDRVMLQMASQMDAAIVTNDSFRDLINESQTYGKIINNRLIGYTWCGDTFILPKDPYGKNGTSLEQILNRF